MTLIFWFCDVQLACFPAKRDSEQFAQIVRRQSDFSLRHDAALRSEVTFNVLIATIVTAGKH